MARHAIHPGEHLAEQLEALNMSAAKLARQLPPAAGVEHQQMIRKTGESI